MLTEDEGDAADHHKCEGVWRSGDDLVCGLVSGKKTLHVRVVVAAA